MVEDAKQDVIIVMGGDSSMNDFLVQPEIASIAELRGRILAVDAPNTAYALLAKKILLKNGLREGQDYTVAPVGGGLPRMKAVLGDKKYAAVVLNVPWSILAVQGGLKSLGRTVDLLGPYQASGAFVMRSWAQANGPVLERYLAAYVESLRWALDPANRAESVGFLVQRLKLAPEIAERTYDLMREPKFGLVPDALRHGGIQESTRAARGDRGPMGRQAARAGEVCRSFVLRAGDEGARALEREGVISDW
jgi:ABC-type nitrate/sulfonate/bicarbonate transport system substrate-binding protein